MDKGWKLYLLGAVWLLFTIFAGRMAYKESKAHETICLDDREWICTQTRVHPIGMAISEECTKWERKL